MAQAAPGLGQLAQLEEVHPEAVVPRLGVLLGDPLAAQGRQQAVRGALGDSQLACDVRDAELTIDGEALQDVQGG